MQFFKDNPGETVSVRIGDGCPLDDRECWSARPNV